MISIATQVISGGVAITPPFPFPLLVFIIISMNHDLLAEFMTIAVLHLLAVISPGPDFLMVSRNSFSYSRRTGVYSSIGLALGILVHVTYSLVGIGLVISKSIVLFSIIKYLGAGYLIYIGIKALTSKPRQDSGIELAQAKQDLTRSAAIKMGFLTNALNPKATLFFLAIFTQVIQPTTPMALKALYGLEMSLMTFVWFSFVAIVLSNPIIQKPFIKFGSYIDKTMGGLLILLGIKVAISNR